MFHYTKLKNIPLIVESPVPQLFGNPVYFSPDYYIDGVQAKCRLALPHADAPDAVFHIASSQIDNLSSPSIVQPLSGDLGRPMPGKGLEQTAPGSVAIYYFQFWHPIDKGDESKTPYCRDFP